MIFATALLQRNPFAFADALLKPSVEPTDVVKAPGDTIIWTTHPELSVSGVCAECEDLAGEYRFDQVPDDPHPWCNCTWIDGETGEDLGKDTLSLFVLSTIGKYNMVHDEHGRFGTGDGSKPSALGMAKAPTALTSRQEADNATALDLIQTGIGGKPHTATGIEDWQLKDQVVGELSARSGLSTAKTDALVGAWAKSSSDSDQKSVALQMAAAEQFGVTPTPYIAGAAAMMADGSFPAAITENVSPATFVQNSADAKIFVASMYDYTQQSLADQGVKSLTLYRGVGFNQTSDSPVTVGPVSAAFDENLTHSNAFEAAAATNGADTIDQNPISSWSLQRATAEEFARNNNGGGGAFVLTAQVPTSRVLSIAATGIGCQGEREVTVIGGTGAQFGTLATAMITPPLKDVINDNGGGNILPGVDFGAQLASGSLNGPKTMDEQLNAGGPVSMKT